jgi:hypothetical protein
MITINIHMISNSSWRRNSQHNSQGMFNDIIEF